MQSFKWALWDGATHLLPNSSQPLVLALHLSLPFPYPIPAGSVMPDSLGLHSPVNKKAFDSVYVFYETWAVTLYMNLVAQLQGKITISGEFKTHNLLIYFL